MTSDPKQLDGVEDAMLELTAARQAGLFSETSVDADMLLRQPAAPSRLRGLFRLMPVAAALAMAVGVGSWMFTGKPMVPSIPGGTEIVANSPDSPCDGRFLHCFSGPSEAVLASCSTHDYDSDGDVDLADFGTFQARCVRPTRTH